MGGEVIPVGPFTGGLNIAQDARLISENELAVCKNFDIGNSGQLILRKGIRTDATPVGLTNGLSSIIAVTRIPTADDEIYLQGSLGGSYTLYWKSGIHNAWNALYTYAANVYAADGVQYNSKLWIPTTGAGAAAGISVDIVTHAVTAVAGMPKGAKAFIYKNRMFTFDTGSYRVYYSASLDPSSWPVANFFDINPGDGEPIISAVVSGESIIFFKNNSTWVLYYDSDPGLGTLRQLNTDIGVTSRDAVTVIANDVYVMNNRGVYRLTNGYYEDISKNLDLFNLRTTNPSQLINDYIRPLGDKLICRLVTSTGYRYFVYSLEASVWTEYTFPSRVDAPFRVEDTDHSEHFISSTELNYTSTLSPYGTVSLITEEPLAQASTKFYDYGDPAGFKRIFWFSGEIKSSHAFVLQARPGQGAALVSTNHAAPLSTNFEIFKNFLTRRFRTIQYSIFAGGGGSLNGSFTFNSGSVSVAAKKRVVARETV